MLMRQLFDHSTCTYTYLIAEYLGGKALLIDPVLEQIKIYQQLIEELNLQLIYAIDTHLHADHITALAMLHEIYGCQTVHGEHSKACGISQFVKDNELLQLGALTLKVLYTPGHTDDSYCILLQHQPNNLLFSGDTLLIRGTGRTDFQQGNSQQQYDSIFNKLLSLDDDTLLYPGHDYRGMTVSTIGEERRCNPRLQVSSTEEYSDLMMSLKLDKPKQFDVAVPANLRGGNV